MSYIIGSFNLRDFNFSNKSSDGEDEEIKRDFNKIAEIIIKEKFDVIALQEINARLPLQYLVSVLNQSKNHFREYKCDFGEDMPNQGGSKDPERYGFIWNTKRLRLVNTRSPNPGYYENAGALGLIRPPYFARFTARGMLGGTNFELRLVNTHIKFASLKELRKAEFDILVRQILPRICDRQEVSEDGEIMPSYTFLLGDYNLELKTIFKVEALTITNYTGKSRSFKTVQDKPTTLRKSAGQTSIDECYANDYDHFTYETDLKDKLLLTPQRVEALTKYFPESSEASDKLKNYRLKVSDHVPIKLTVDLK